MISWRWIDDLTIEDASYGAFVTQVYGLPMRFYLPSGKFKQLLGGKKINSVWGTVVQLLTLL
jgi:hypothetical protein